MSQVKYPNPIGETYNMLKIVEDAGYKNGAHYVTVKCECGNIVDRTLYQVRHNIVKSCGCANVWCTTHGFSRLPEHSIWMGIKRRCTDPQNQSYAYYGGRGITIAPEWIDDFEAFLNYVGDRPDPSMSIDRINVDGNYEPGNVRWANQRTQVLNTRRKTLVIYNDQEILLDDVPRPDWLSYEVLRHRIVHNKWTLEDALTRPVRFRTKKADLQKVVG